MTSVPRDTRVAYLDLLRCAAAVAVVLLHAAALCWAKVPLRGASWVGLALLDSAVRWSVPVFFMITGALFLTRSAPVTPRAMLRGSLPRLASAFIFWAMVYRLFAAFEKGREPTVLTVIREMPRGYYHLWFLPVMMGIYLLMPVLWHIFQNRVLARYLVVLWLVMVLLKATEKFDPTLVLSGMADRVLGPELAGYAPFVLLGALVASSSRRVPRWLLPMALVGSISIVFLLTVRLSWARGVPDGYWFAYLTPAVVISGVAVFALARSQEQRLQRRQRLQAALAWFGARTLGIYLVHPLVLGLATKYSIIPIEPMVPRVLALWLMALAVSLLATILIRQIPWLGARLV
ncbi:acyltransferase family protein [Luteococcus sp. H138]|uniref:acyltransferase n=1 Tax=unclassified Luteococcus TaxID=2639923 RepID=UPI00313E63C3